MSPGVNDPRNTGALPKSNRRNDRNRERSAANQIANRSAYHGQAPQQSNNLFPLDWKPIGDRGPPRVAKNSNTRSVSSAPSTSYQDISDFASYSCGRQYNYSSEELGYWQKMVPPTDSRTQSPPRVQSTKPSNVDKMPDRSHVESRLNQIRDYIKVSSTMMDELSQSNDPCAQAQHEKLGRMVEDLYDSESKLSKLLELYQNRALDQNGDSGGDDLEGSDDLSREIVLRKKMEESQKKMAQLQEHQATLVGMQLRLREQLTHARQAQQALLENEHSSTPSPPVALPSKLEQLESETAALKGKLAQLQDKKKHMDHFVAELQSMELTTDRASSSSDGSRNIRDKAAELEAMRAQVAHLKALMEEATKAREYGDNTSEPEPDVDIADEGGEDAEAHDDENEVHMSFERQSDSDETSHGKVTNADDRPLVEKILAGTQEVRDAAQTALLQSVGTVLQRLQQPPPSANQPNVPSTYPSFTPPPSLAASINSENKQTNAAIIEGQAIQEKRRQLEEFARKESSQASSVHCEAPVAEVNSHKSSSSQISHSSTPANIWPSPAGLHERNGEAITSSESLLDAGSLHPPAIENGFHANWLPYPMPPMNQLQHGSAEYYRQLLLGSQSQQLQMMGVTLQQCCQLLASQQRELQSMRSAITQLQVQVRENQSVQRVSSAENPEDYSNLSRSTHHLGETLDGSLPPSSSLPNLVSLPNSAPAVSHTGTGSAINSQPHNQQQQLNNQVPPGNRANNYWDNFRSYSRQNLLSGNPKTVTDTSSGAVANTVASGIGTASGVTTSTLIKDKRNRDQASEHLALPSFVAAEAQYSLNLQSQSNVQLQERDNISSRSNIFANEISQPQAESHREGAHAPHRLPTGGNDDNPLQNLSPEMKETLCSLHWIVVLLRETKIIGEDKRLQPRLLKSLRALLETQASANHLNETTDQTASESCQSSDEDSDVGIASGINLETQSSAAELIPVPQAGTSSSPTIQAPLMDNLVLPEPLSSDHLHTLPSSSNLKPGNNEDLAEADQSRPEAPGNQQIYNGDCGPEEGQEEGAACLVSAQSALEVDADSENSAKAEDERSEVPKHEKVNARQYHH